MKIEKVKIINFKCFDGLFELVLNDSINIIVGNNEAGKSTILESIHLALTGMLSGKNVRNELTQYLFNKEVVDRYLLCIEKRQPAELPEICIEIYFKGEEMPLFEGNGNSERRKASGVSFKIAFNDDFQSEYEALIKTGDIKTLPIEYYGVFWTAFSREKITSRSMPIKSALIDSSCNRYQNGSDVYISQIVKENLEQEDIVNISQAHRRIRENFMVDPVIEKINEKITQDAILTNKKIEISVELLTKNAWENSLVTQLDDIPFNYIGKGEQCIVKTALAMSNKKAQKASVILLEEPENHLSYSKLNQLIGCIKEKYEDKQLIISTHNSFVANKLGLDNLILLNDHRITKLNDLKNDTKQFFQKIAGYDTLRLVLCKKAILVEGDSDELVLQKAYMVENEGKLPIEEEIDVISVGTSFLRFLEISEKLHKPTSVVTDNDGNIESIKMKYSDYIDKNAKEYIKLCVDYEVDKGDLKIGDKPFNYNTLEPKILKVNSLEKLNSILEVDYKTEDELRKYMRLNKTECAFKIFETDQEMVFPQYIREAIDADE